MTALVCADFNAGHGEVDPGEKILYDVFFRHILDRLYFARSIQSPTVERVKLVAAHRDQPLDGLGKRPRPDRRPVVIPEPDASPHEVIGDAEIIRMRPVEVRKVERVGAWEGQTPHRIGLTELDDG